MTILIKYNILYQYAVLIGNSTYPPPISQPHSLIKRNAGKLKKIHI